MRQFRTKFVFLFGGLGNQLFQFVYAHYVAKITREKVILLDATRRLRVSRKYELKYLTSGCNHKVSGMSLSVFSVFLAKSLKGLYKFSVFVKRKFLLQDNSETGSYLNIGHFQNIKYLNFVEEEILSDLKKVLLESTPKSQRQAREGIKLTAHIRRGDYDANHHGHLSLEYYAKIFTKLDYNLLLVHTDDNTITNQIYEKFPGCIVYGPGEASAWDVIIDLANSDIAVTANSTLSWWGAWLCVKNGGQAYLPSIWFKNEMSRPPALSDQFFLEESIWD